MAIQKLFTSRANNTDGNTYIGERGHLFYNESIGLLRLSDGATPGGLPIVVASTSANLGDLYVVGPTISTVNPNEDLELESNGTGNVIVIGNFKVQNTAETLTALNIDQQGFTTINVPTININQYGLLINGGAATPNPATNPQVSGTSLRIIGNDGLSNTIALDSFGTAVFPGSVDRAARGSSSSPAAIQSGDTLGRWAAVGWGTTNYVIDPILGRAAADIRFVATENFTDAQGGTQIQFYTSPNGGTVRTLSVTMDYTGITTGNLHSTNVFVSGNTISTGTTQAIGNFTANGTSNLIGVVTTQGNLNVIGNFTGNGTSIMQGTTQAIGNFTANGTSKLIGNVLMSGTANVTGVFTANGVSTLIGNVNTTGNLNVGGNLNIVGTSINTGTTLMIGNTTTIGTTTLTGDVHIAGNVDTTGASASFGTSTFTGAVTIDGPMTINNQIAITALGNIQFNDGTVQTTSAVQNVSNAGHITGALNNIGSVKTLSVTSDATPNNTAGTIVSRDGSGNIAVGNVTMTAFQTTSINANNAIAGSLTVLGNLNVVGTTTTTNSTVASTTNKTLTLANGAATSTQADASGILIGSNTVFADFLYDSLQTAWRSNIGFVPAVNLQSSLGSGTRQWNTVFANVADISTQIQVGPTPNTTFANSPGQFTGNANVWVQVTNQNMSNGTEASTDFVATNDVGNDNTHYIDMGINSSTYNDPAYGITKANDGYLYVDQGNLAIGTDTTGKDLVFFTDGTTASNEVGRVHLGRWTIGQAVDDGVSRFQIKGQTTVTGNLVVNGNIILSGSSAFTSLSTANGLVATGLTQGGALPITTSQAEFTTVPAGSGAILPSNPPAGALIFIANDTNNPLFLYPATGGVIDFGNANQPIVISGQGMWTGTALYDNHWTTLNPDPQQATDQNITITQGNGAVYFGLASSISVSGTVSSTNITVLTNGLTAANTNITTNTTNIATLNANIGAYEAYANSAIGTHTTNIATLNANIGAYELFANANVAGLQNQITGANTNIATGVTNFNTLNANVGAFETYANTAISSITTNANANTAAYLTTATITTTGNITAGNLIATTLIHGSIVGATGSFTGNVSAGNLIATAHYGNVVGTTSTLTGNVTAGNLVTTGNTYAGNVIVTANVTAANVNATLHGNVIGVASSVATNTTSFATSFLTGQVNIPSQTIAKNTLAQDLTVTVTGLTTSHKVIVTPAADLNPGIVIGAAYPSSANTLGVQLQNPNGGAITTSAFNLTYMAWI